MLSSLVSRQNADIEGPMTWNDCVRTLLALALALALSIGLSLPASARDEIFAETTPVALNLDDRDQEGVGQLIYRGGLDIAPGDEDIGGISGLTWHEDRLYAVSDDGHWLTIEPDEFDGRLIDLLTVERGPLRDERGKQLKGKDASDAEAITRGPEGDWLVAFERDHRVIEYKDLEGPGISVAGIPAFAALLELAANAAPNSGIETLELSGNGAISCGEWVRAGEANCVRISSDGLKRFELMPPALLAEHGGTPTDASCLDDGTCFILFRSYRAPEDGGEGNRAAIVKLPVEGDPETLAVFTAPLTLDNFEGLAAREEGGKIALYIVSDNNFSDDQRTLLMKFEVKAPEPVIIPPPPEPEIVYETTDVILQTTKGDITIRLEVERAPITATNFLAYVDERRFDGTTFYRSVKFRLEPDPYGLVQGGTQYERKRLRPNIAHEPTNVTGLSHTNGAVSMARVGPGTANGDFTIMLGDLTSLDAKPDSDNRDERDGFAVFGYVVEGMDVVAAIHAGDADPREKGALAGETLARPVVITKAVRAKVQPE